MSSYGIHWFRRDLRVAGNLALQKQHSLNNGKVLGLFCFDKKFLSRSDFSVNRFQLFLNSLAALRKELREIGSDLLVMDVGPFDAFPKLFETLENAKISLPSHVSWNRDYEPFARVRDERMEVLLREYEIPYFHERDHLLIEPWELKKDKGEGYQVYSPFAKRWLALFQKEEFQSRIKVQKKGFTYLKKRLKGETDQIFSLTWKNLLKGMSIEDHLDSYVTENGKKVSVQIPETGSLAAYELAKSFKKHVEDYSDLRDFPNAQGTSRLSPYLKNGSITVPQLIALYDLQPYCKKKTGADTYLSELIWREFYYHILYRHPHVERESFNPKYKDIKWENNKRYFDAWTKGLTGFPIVDAGMRELATTGWIHNRVRMIVASFLTKDLLIDWRWGEKYFMETLLDGDLAANNGGWQWAASTGCDPQPYFRIFNPWLQGEKFDPEGAYIKKFIPELMNVSAKNLHAPILDHPNYPEPIVDHSTQRNRALAMYKFEGKIP